MPKSRNPGYKPGDHWCICDRCGFAYRESEMRETWDGLVVCKEDWEPRHPQDFVRAVPDQIAAQGLVRPEPNDIYISVCSPLAVAGVAIAGCAVAGYNQPTIPAGTFNIGL